MELDENTVKRIAELSRLELAEHEVKEYQEAMLKMLHAFHDLTNIPIPSEIHGDARSALLINQALNNNEEISRMQPDKNYNSLSSQIFLSQAPEREGVFIRVPAILSPST